MSEVEREIPAHVAAFEAEQTKSLGERDPAVLMQYARNLAGSPNRADKQKVLAVLQEVLDSRDAAHEIECLEYTVRGPGMLDTPVSCLLR
jgi:hypothetical protein